MAQEHGITIPDKQGSASKLIGEVGFGGAVFPGGT